jgi:hypothetical protein
MQTAQHRPATAAHLPPGALTPDAQAHRRRCRNVPPVQPGEAERLMAEFLRNRGVTACPTRYALPVEQRAQLTRNPY